MLPLKAEKENKKTKQDEEKKGGDLKLPHPPQKQTTLLLEEPVLAGHQGSYL